MDPDLTPDKKMDPDLTLISNIPKIWKLIQKEIVLKSNNLRFEILSWKAIDIKMFKRRKQIFLCKVSAVKHPKWG
jgi:hypothetical protein